MFFIRLLIYHESGVHLLAPSRIATVIEGTAKNLALGTEETQKKDTYELMFVSTDIKYHTQDVLAGRQDRAFAFTYDAAVKSHGSFHAYSPPMIAYVCPGPGPGPTTCSTMLKPPPSIQECVS